MRANSRLAFILLCGAAVAGCNGANSDSSAKMTAEAPTDTELAAYAASHPYPATQPAQEVKVAAIASPDRSTIKLYNFSNQPFSEIDVWVNGSWLQHVRGLPANGSIIIKSSDLYNAFGKNFASQKEPVSRVQLKTNGGFYDVMGPVAQ
ncbi:MAG TPA: hypothetical protein VG326_20465 [Tepidisphaeraceae bacterium]|jgi:hypothetical protein|nr:hypothetical protein [Tepidisphaeraceae bacterium]